MTTRIILVLGDDGDPQQLQPGDNVSSVSETGQRSVTADAAVVAGAPVYATTADHVNKARANASATKDVFGLAIADIASGAIGTVQTNGVLALTTAQWDVITGGTGGLTVGSWYYLDPATAGKLTTVRPTTVGQYVGKVILALSTTEADIRIRTTYLL